MAPKKHKPKLHHRMPPPRSMVRRNASDIPADVLLDLAPVPAPFAAAPARPRPPSKAARLARAMKPKGATVTKDHLLGVGANAAGAVVTSLAANELVDNVGVMPMAIGATVAGGLGSALLEGRWQQVAQGVLGAGVGQLGTAYLAQRGLKKAATVAPAPAAPPKRNGYLAASDDDDEPLDEGAMARAMARTERRVDALLAAERNGSDGYDERLGDRYAMAYGPISDGFEPVFGG